jgi:diguanylate cyclase (GGDEF)-like protein/PAS domain S-box-containing protein
MSVPGSTILIVDDEAQNRRLLAVLLQPEGYRTTSAASGEEALASISNSAPDLILLDIMMPGIDGYQVASILKANPATSNIPIIMVTALMERSARLAGLDAGAEEFLTKPVDRAELWLRVRNLLRLKAFGDLLSHTLNLEQQVQERTVDLQRFRTAMDATADAILLVSRSTMRFVEVNATACHMLGYTRAEMFTIGPERLAEAPGQMTDLYDGVIEGDGTRAIVETRLRRKDGTYIQVEVQRQALRSGTDWVVVAVVRDITERKDAEKRLHHQAHHDALTGLPNRTLFYQTLEKTLALATDSGWLVAVMFIDLDHFKIVNDTLGHTIGDELLVQFSNRLLRCVRIRDTVGRLGGDEFALILVLHDGQQGAALVAKKILEVLREPFTLHGHEVTVTASIGLTVHPDDACDPDTLIKYADTAMYRAKQAGRDTYRFFTAQMNVDVLARLELETALRRAVDNQEFVLHFQPKARLNSGRISGVEALLRWQRPGYGLVPPNEFIPLLESTGLIVRVGSWVIATACRQIGAWVRSAVGPVQVSVNVSGRQFIEGNLDRDVIKALRENDIPADLLELELTESSLMANTEHTIATLQNLKRCGVEISIDDFGTGYSSLAYLRRFPIDKLKIDRAFIRDVTTNPDEAAIVLAIIQMAHCLKLEVIAEGVENKAQLAYLRRHRCDQIQGYFLSRPLPVPELEVLLLEFNGFLSPFGEAPGPLPTLLLVDPDPGVLEALQGVLRQDDYHILSARTASEGLELLALNQVHVILSEQHMPGMNGTQFLDLVKDLYPDTYRIILSEYSDMESIMDAVNRGVIYRFYGKPWQDEVLRNHLREAFRHFRLSRDRSAGAPRREVQWQPVGSPADRRAYGLHDR